MIPEQPVPISELRCEGFSDAEIESFVRDRGVDIFLDDLGRRCVDRDVARALIAERARVNAIREAQAEERAARYAEQEATRQRDWLARRAAIDAAANIVSVSDDVGALAVLRLGELLEKQREADERIEEQLSGTSVYHRITHRKDNEE